MIQGTGQVDTPLEWGAVAVIVGVILTFLAKYVLPLIKNGKSSKDGLSGATLAEISSIITAVTRAEMRIVVDEIKESKIGTAAMVAALQAVTVTLTALTERIQHLPTKSDLEAQHRDSRHDARNAMAASTAITQDAVNQRADEVIRLLSK